MPELMSIKASEVVKRFMSPVVIVSWYRRAQSPISPIQITLGGDRTERSSISSPRQFHSSIYDLHNIYTPFTAIIH